MTPQPQGAPGGWQQPQDLQTSGQGAQLDQSQQQPYVSSSQSAPFEQPGAPEPTQAPQPGAKKSPKLKLVAIVAAVVVVVVVAAAIIVPQFLREEVDVTSGVEVLYSGVSGYATAELSGTDTWETAARVALIDRAKTTAELEEWMELLEASVSFELSATENVSNGDVLTVTVTIDEEAIADVPVNLVASEVSVTVEGLTEATTIDLFEGVEVSYSGYAPYATAYIESAQWVGDVWVYYSVDADYVDNGDTITITASYDAASLLANGYVAESDTMTVTVEGLTSYASSLDDIPDDTMTKMRSQAEDVFAAYVANNWSSSETLESIEYVGCYFLTPKSATSATGNRLYLVYEVKGSNSKDGDFKYYAVYLYTGITILADGTCSVDLDACTRCGSKFYFSSYNYYYYGYQTLDSAFSACVTSYVDNWQYETTVE